MRRVWLLIALVLAACAAPSPPEPAPPPAEARMRGVSAQVPCPPELSGSCYPVWFGTNPLSRKVSEIRHNPRVTLYYFDRESQAYVTIQGIARLVNDPKEKARHWKEDWKAFYPDRDKSYLLIEVRPLRLEVVNTKTGVIGTSRDWAPPSVNFRRRSRYRER